jgi:predicted transcriptional regulator
MSTQSTTVTVRLSPELENRLAELAHQTRRSKSFHAREAIQAYVEHELEMVQGIERGMADIEAGNVVSHAEAMRQIKAAATAK